MSIKIASMNFGDCDTILHNTTNGMKNIAEVLGPNGEVYWSSIKEITATPPLSIRSNGTMLLDYLISGNMTQSATPTPTTPIQPQETGEKTGNLFDGTKLEKCAFLNGTYSNPSEGTVRNIIYIPVIGGNTYTFSINSIVSETSFQSVCSVDKPALGVSYLIGGNTTFITHGAVTTFTRTIPNSANWWAIQIMSLDNLSNNIMINEGSTALPYEKFGYKIPISSANITTNIYLGEVPTTRKIRKLVLDGTEEWRIWALPSSYSVERYFINVSGVRTQRGSICSHFLWSPDDTDQERFRFGGTNLSEFLIFIKKETVATITDFKSYLAAQYAAGTPVCVWYVLAEPETAVVNEPLRKIGDYADTLSYEQAGVQIPTLHGNTVIDVETTLKPSQMYIKYK